MEDLTPQQTKELIDFLKFERQNRDETRGEISVELNELLKEKFNRDDTYGGKEALKTLAEFPEAIAKTMHTELIHMRDINVNLIRQILLDAQKENLLLELSIPDLENEASTDAANLLAGKLIMNADKMPAAKETKDEAPVDEKIDVEALMAENEKLRAQLQQNKRQWPEFIEAQNKLKNLNTEVHDLRHKLGKE
ncbi:hypothetical protein TVAG_476090 [Trichomonas vaginalis G3]|uniref:Leucine zipper transcription factor-like protein 1 n=1 Tax=Trichomonas vaginalis (strain ATCC PRA-98 / G3) TaxID=412133 RepID=A2DA32_TRIV3|nr:leucine zipper transcription factor like family [Trichomonas vaginalis G3]EAY22680.1 hypothetical protein TVAG_476090 [Trichomonas vaginalis G3]KAI5525494.1 leucine zipper transcription factor like family [Trichomonas vaginalis G3]|eukprot:XP_001583666.1 hypothetical protein [Trichomonas vaginalis G3]